jgi:hypothetical protein
MAALGGCDDGDAVKSPEPTAAPTPGVGQMVGIAGNGTGVGWDGKSLAAGHGIGDVGPVVTLPDGGLLVTTEAAPQVLRLDTDGRLKDLGVGAPVGRILAAASGGELVGILADEKRVLTIRPSDGAVKDLADLPALTAQPDTPAGDSIIRSGDAWWVQRGAQVLAVSDAGKVSPVTLPVVPGVLAVDGDDLLVATKDEVVRVVAGKITTRMSLRGLDLLPGYLPGAMVADGKGGAYVAMDGQAAVVHATPGAEPKILLRGKPGITTQCAQVPIGDLMAAPLAEIEGLTLWDGDLVIADRECEKIYQYGLPK